ncbi:MAG: ROK family protein, partial [Candidatus Micrarchaeota archaeon]|nr:ROK family protein [Candidatus Micrarchaeota archaeon]
MDRLLGIDVGASKIEYGMLSGGRLDGVLRIGTDRTLDSEGLAELLDGLIRGAAGVRSGRGGALAGLRAGIGVPGYVQDGKVKRLPNLPAVKPLDLRGALSRRLGIPVQVENDVKCMALGIWHARGRRRNDSFLLVAPGTGIGGAIVLDGKLLRGPHNTAGEFGHMEVGGVEWEKISGGWGIERAYWERTGRRERASAIFRRRDPAAHGVCQKAAGALGTGLAGLANALDPERIVLSGGLAGAYLGPARARMLKEYAARAIGPVAKTPIIRSPVPRPALLGAALLAGA